MKKTKIDWCDCTINPVVGCKNGCKYCYAKKINDRFKFIPIWEEPQFFEERLLQLKSKTPKSIFMDSMSDIGLWEREWIDKVFNAIRQNKQHNYIFLSKCGNGYIGDKHNHDLLNCWFGFSLVKQAQIENVINKSWFDFLSIEPLLEPLDLSAMRIRQIELVIIGAETGTRKDKVIPKKEWVDNIVKFCNENNISVFMKESLREIMGNDFRQDKLIWDLGE
jgi:protein gp37